jgi:hypothetical protein
MNHRSRSLAISSVLITVLPLLAAVGCGSNKVTVAENGKSPYAIVLSANPSPSERHAAEELRMHIARATGAELPVVSEPDPRSSQPPRIFVGFGEGASKALAGGTPVVADSLGDEGFVMRMVKSDGGTPDIVLAGGRLRGSMYGVYTFLDRMGFRWYTSTLTRFPEGKILRIGTLDEKKIPVFMYREPYIKEAFDGDWAARNRVNSGSAALDSTRGGSVVVLGVHTFDSLIPPALFKEHPEYFPLIGGKRVTGYVQRCLSNPDLVEVAAKNLIAWMDSDPNHHIFDLSQNDVEKNCECPECTKIMEAEGAPSGLYISFVNKVAEIVEKKHPENYVETLAYMFSEKPPKTVKPRHNVLIRLCPIYMCAGHPFTTCTSPETKKFNETLIGWSKLTDRIFIWHYATDFSSYLAPFPNFKNFASSIKTYAKSGVKGIFMQCAYTSPGSSDAELRGWVMARLLWNPDDDPDALVNEWMHGVYGGAFAPMRAAFDLAHVRFSDPNRHLRIFDMPSHDFWPEKITSSFDSLFASAEKLAAGDSTSLYYVRKNRMSIRYLQLFQNSGILAVKGAVYGPSENTATMADYDKFIEGMKEFGITGLREEPFDCNLVTQLKQRLEDHPVTVLENADLRLEIVPDLGGRIVGITLKGTGERILSRTNRDSYFYPASGGYDESTTRTWASTGFSNPYTAVVKGRTITLTAQGIKGLVFRRTMTLPEKGTRIEIGSSITNSSTAPVIARLVCLMELNANPDSATVDTGADGVKAAGVKNAGSSLPSWAGEKKAADFYLDGPKKPAGVWKVKSAPGGWCMENRFSATDVEACRLVCDKKSKTVSMEISGFERDLAPGKSLALKHVWNIGK